MTPVWFVQKWPLLGVTVVKSGILAWHLDTPKPLDIRFLVLMSPLVILVCLKMATRGDYHSKIGKIGLQTTVYKIFGVTHFKWRSISRTPCSLQQVP